MLTTPEYPEKPVILVELKPRNDIRGTTNVSAIGNDIAAKSSEALSKAMTSIKDMTRRIVDTVQEIPVSQRPDEVEVEFGLKLTTDANALIVNTGAEAHFAVTLKWARKAEDSTP